MKFSNTKIWYLEKVKAQGLNQIRIEHILIPHQNVGMNFVFLGEVYLVNLTRWFRSRSNSNNLLRGHYIIRNVKAIERHWDIVPWKFKSLTNCLKSTPKQSSQCRLILLGNCNVLCACSYVTKILQTSRRKWLICS
jgi:hypothetical protein